MGLREYIVRRLLYSVPTFLLVSVIIFVIVRVMPGDPAVAMLGDLATAEDIKNIRRALRLDEPLPLQYLTYLSGVLQGDLGTSVWTRTPVLTEILSRFPATIEVTVLAAVIAAIIGIFSGTLSAVKRNSWLDHANRVWVLAGSSMPFFWLGLMLQILFAAQLGWFPVSGRIDREFLPQYITGLYIIDSLLTGNLGSLNSTIRHLILPAITSAAFAAAIASRMVRISILEVLVQQYITAARAKGLPERIVLYKHALRNALIPIVTIFGIMVAWGLGGSILIETVFSWPGMGRYMFEAIGKRDFPVIQGVVLFYSITLVTVNLLVDIAYGYINPQIRYE